MIHKSTPERRHWWATFAVATQDKSIVKKGVGKVRKSDVFDHVYDPSTADQVRLELIMHGWDDEFATVDRVDLPDVSGESHLIDEITQEVLKEEAVRLCRTTDINDIVSSMATAISTGMSEAKRIDDEIRRRVKEKRQQEVVA